MEEYNERFTKMNLVLFDDALEHLTRLHRVMRMHRGHAMVVGVGGCGKNSLTRLAAFTAGKCNNLRVVSINITRLNLVCCLGLFHSTF